MHDTGHTPRSSREHGAVRRPDATRTPQDAAIYGARSPRGAACVAFGAALLLVWSSIAATAAAQDALPRLPCGTAASFPAYPADAAPGVAPAVVRAWQAGDGSPPWTPPACTGWAAAGGHGFRTLIALAGRIRLAGNGVDRLLGRFGAVSMLRGARYWSVSDGGWRPLVSDASALDGPDADRHRPDFTAAELGSGRDFYFVQSDGRSSGGVVYRLRVRESGPDRLVVQTENVTPIRLAVFTLFRPGALQAVHFLRRLSPTDWAYYGLSRTIEEGSSPLTGGHEASFVNRAAALFRFLAGVPTDRDPPMAP